MKVSREKLEALMIKNLLTNATLAEKAGININTVSKIRNGKNASIASMKKICNALKCQPEDLI